MAPSATHQVLLSPAELSYLHTSLSLTPPVRPDLRTANQFRPLVAETNILPGTNGSARICFADGTEAIVGVKAEVEKSRSSYHSYDELDTAGDVDEDDNEGEMGLNEWVELTVEIPGFRDDDPMPVFLAAMLSEALVADVQFARRLYINRRFHWKLYLDILLLSQPLSYPLPLLSLTTHLALLSTRLPKLKSEADEDPLFDDDWEESVFLYPRAPRGAHQRPPVTLLVMAVKDNIIFDPCKEELAVAEAVLAVSVGERVAGDAKEGSMEIDPGKGRRDVRVLAVRTIDPPSRLTHPGIPNTQNTATGGAAPATMEQAANQRETTEEEGVWQPPRGGAQRKLIALMIQRLLEPGGVAEEVLDGLDAVELG
ncbi:hypothetical protein OIDMADRAFT_100553 [Oidiodendron maius Zn]|uniref:Ribosomal RNA-processing protein 42 n=1 Tax=Oidiodendron maius (strain Zn) TaxID=913774 RepID=A0A0C3HTJ3_OIDMZ|nr:hypothetical protein OIDMADRAFT_100553 [Oidiodendron maius Zn]